MTAELATIQQSWNSLQTTLTTITAERDAAHRTFNGLQLVLDQAEKRVSTIRTDLTDTQADRNALRESLNQWKERHTAIEKSLLLAQASVEQANKELWNCKNLIFVMLRERAKRRKSRLRVPMHKSGTDQLVVALKGLPETSLTFPSAAMPMTGYSTAAARNKHVSCCVKSHNV